jgi:peptidoglycan/LPS O-acetylase OafA/YrhL
VSKNTVPYLWSRFARVYPLYLFCIMFAWLSTGGAVNLLPYLLVIQSWNANLDVAFGLDGPAWSISVEAFLYISFPFVMLAFRALGIFDSRRRVLITAALALIPLFGLALYFMLTGHGGVDSSAYDPRSAHRWLYRMPLTRLLDFVLGVLAAVFVMRFAGSIEQRRSYLWTLVTYLSMAVISGLMMYQPLYRTAWSWDSAFAVPFVLVIVGTAISRDSMLSKLLSTKLMLLLGASSYAFYLIHVMMFPMRSTAANATHPMIFYLMLLALICCVSVGLHLSIEEPCRKFLLSIFRRGGKFAAFSPLNPRK